MFQSSKQLKSSIVHEPLLPPVGGRPGRGLNRNSQSYNRYSYSVNNPLKYVDPSGYGYKPDDWDGKVDISPAYWIFLGSANQHHYGAGSGNHWSDGHRGEYGNFMLMSGQTFVNYYGQDAYYDVFNNVVNQSLSNSTSVPVTDILVSGWAGNPFMIFRGLVLEDGTMWYTEDGVDALFALLGGAISGGDMRYGNDFAKELQYHYENGNGADYRLTKERLYDIYNKALINGSFEWDKAKSMGNSIYKVPTNLYKTDYFLSFGRATMYIYNDFSGKIYPTGFFDTWDLDPKPWGTRSIPAEIITRYFNWSLTGTNFIIRYP